MSLFPAGPVELERILFPTVATAQAAADFSRY
jgi:hypothetical protein